MLAEYRSAFQRELEATLDLDTARRRTLHLRAHCYPEMNVETRERVLTHLESKVVEEVLGKPQQAINPS